MKVKFMLKRRIVNFTNQKSNLIFQEANEY